MNLPGTLLIGLALLVGVIFLVFRRTRNLGTILAALAFCVIFYFSWQSHHWASGFEQVALGVSEADVVLKVGTPQRITDGTTWVEPGFKKAASELVPGCKKEYWYNTFYFPEAFSFCFNQQSQLIHKYHWVMW